jgi:hypothetical protein
MHKIFSFSVALLLTACISQPQKMEVSKILIGSELSERQEIVRETRVFSSEDMSFHAHVFTKGAAEPTKLAGAWWYLPQNRKIFETRSEVSAELPVAKFLLSNSNGWPVGEYKFEISHEGVVLAEKIIQVKEGE